MDNWIFSSSLTKLIPGNQKTRLMNIFLLNTVYLNWKIWIHVYKIFVYYLNNHQKKNDDYKMDKLKW